MTEFFRTHFPEWGVALEVTGQVSVMSESEIARRGNGCGRAGIEGRLVPDTILGVWVGMVCDVHDIETTQVWQMALWFVHLGSKTPAEADAWLDQAELEIDRKFRSNLHAVIDQKSGRSVILRDARHKIADFYGHAVERVDVCQVDNTGSAKNGVTHVE